MASVTAPRTAPVPMTAIDRVIGPARLEMGAQTRDLQRSRVGQFVAAR